MSDDRHGNTSLVVAGGAEISIPHLRLLSSGSELDAGSNQSVITKGTVVGGVVEEPQASEVGVYTLENGECGLDLF